MLRLRPFFAVAFLGSMPAPTVAAERIRIEPT